VITKKLHSGIPDQKDKLVILSPTFKTTSDHTLEDVWDYPPQVYFTKIPSVLCEPQWKKMGRGK